MANKSKTNSVNTITPKKSTSSTSRRVGKFAIVGATLALFNYLVYELLARLVFNNNELLWLDSIIAYLAATTLAFIMHSRITWKERHVTGHGIAMFFLWNGITAIIISPIFTWLFTNITPVYDFAHSISSALSLPFDYEFIQSTGVFGFTTAVTMVLNYYFYDRLVFDDTYLSRTFAKLKSRLHKPTKSQVLAFLLYLLPIIFSIITVTLITTSGEDNFQGAGNLAAGAPIDVVKDATGAFEFNSRLTDMYAWSVIDFYDYQFAFGPDTLLRILDVVLTTLVFYFATYLILARSPRLTIKDSLIFCAIFTTFIITPFGRTFYIEFSMLHNYVPLALITLLFSIPYIHLITSPRESKHPLFFALVMLGAGLIFGMSATITPIAFLLTVILYCLIRRKTLVKPPLWFWSGLLGSFAGFLICWLAGSGINHYTDPTTAATFDYLPLSDIFTNIPKLVFHEVYNFGITLIPLLGIALVCIFFMNHRRKIFTKSHLTHLSPATVNLLIVFGLFIFIHVLGASLVKAPPRLLIPVELAGLIIIFRLFAPYLTSKPLAYIVVIFTTLTVITHAVLLAKYHHEMSIVLDNIKSSPEPTICLSPEDTKPTRIPIIDLAQANIIVDWNAPEPIHGKGVINCE